MKLAEAIERVRLEKPNGFEASMLTGFINEVEEMVRVYLEDESYHLPLNFTEDSNEDLLIPPPFDLVYIAYLKAKIDYINEEWEAYQNDQAQFELTFADWKNYAQRNGLVPQDVPRKIINWW